MRSSLAMLLPLLAACGRDPTLLADMGDVDVLVSYNLMSTSGPGAVDVNLTPAEGCPTFVGDATFNGVDLEGEELGHTETQSTWFIPTSVCVPPHLSNGAPRGIGIDEPLAVELVDDSATWSITHDDGFTMHYTEPAGPYHVGDELRFAWDGPAPNYVFVQGWQEEKGLYFPYEADADGNFTATVSDDTRPGTIRVIVTSYLDYAPDGCDGPARCEVSVEYGQVFELLVE